MKKKRRKLSSEQLQLMSFYVIPCLLVFVFSYIPMFGIVIAFKDYKYNLGILGSDWVGLDNFIYFFKTNDFWRITKNTIVLNFTFIIVGMLCAIAFATALFEMRNKYAVKFYQTVGIIPHFLSWVVIGFVVYGFLHPDYGIINEVLAKLGMKKVEWYSDPRPWPFILTLGNTWKHVGMDSVLYYATMMGIDKSLYEAAQIDGANKKEQILNITIPALVPIIVINVILKVGGIFRADFGLFYQLTRNVGALYSATDVIDTYIYRTMSVFGDMSGSAAMGLLQSVVGFVLVVFTNTVVKRVDRDLSLF